MIPLPRTSLQCPDDQIKLNLEQRALSHKITHSALSDLLKLLQPVIQGLPFDSRTLLKTPRNVEYTKMCNGYYHYIGIRKHILTKVYQSTVNLVIHIDGLPLYKSSRKEFWTILGYIMHDQTPFPIAIFCGKGKPTLHDFLHPLVDELHILSQEMVIEQEHVSKTLFLCDAPARAYIKCIKGHSGYSSCDRCEEDTEPGNRIIHTASMGALRSDESFRMRAHPAHHTGYAFAVFL